MIKIRIYKTKDEKERKVLRHAAEYFISRLLPKKKRLDIKIVINPNLLTEEKMSGSCEPQDEAVNHKHYEFRIEIDARLNLTDKLSILAHELTHVKQYTTGQLYSDARKHDISIWEGKPYNDQKVKYENQPWEIDAQFYEELLLDEIIATGILKKYG
jgi:predicted metallopeptidase